MTIRGIGKKIERVGVPLLILFIIITIRYNEIFQYTQRYILYIRVIGIIVFVVGLIVHIYSASIMLNGFNNNRLVTNGPYAYCRNPMYSTIFFLITPGLSFIINSWIFLFAIPILLTIFLINIKEEDEYLKIEYGEEYLNYKQNVKMLIPKLF